MRFYLLIVAVFTVASAQQYTTPVPILKQINKHNEDGSYSYGYEAADGTYKIETKYPNGEVFGKYGYVDDQGQLRTVEYGASRRGFEPAGNEIQVPPPTLKNNHNAARPLGDGEEDDGQYREDPAVYYQNEPRSRSNNQKIPQSIYRQPSFDPQPAFEERSYQPSYRPQPQPAYRPQPQPQPAYRPQPAFRPQPNYNNFDNFNSRPTYYNNPTPPAHPNYHPFQGHPATNVDLWTGSYSVNYRK